MKICKSEEETNDTEKLPLSVNNECENKYCNEAYNTLCLALFLMNSSTNTKELDDFSIIIDTSLSASLFKNEKLVKDITSTKRVLKLITNSRSISSRMMGTLKDMKV